MLVLEASSKVVGGNWRTIGQKRRGAGHVCRQREERQRRNFDKLNFGGK